MPNMNSADVSKTILRLYGEITGFSQIGSWVNGELLVGEGETLALVDPSSGQQFAEFKDSGTAIVDKAMIAAQRAQEEWFALTASARGRIMWDIARLLREYTPLFSELETRSSGRPIRDTNGEASRIAEMFEYYGGWADKIHGDVIPVPTSHLNYTRLEPMGTVVQITPWNAPLATAGWQVAPAIAAGNAVVLKPSELTPLTSIAMGVLCERAGAPKGLVNVIAGHGRTAGQHAVSHRKTNMIVFVGSAATGSRIAASAAVNTVPCLLELGGKSANIIFADADLDQAVIGAQSAIFAGAGQSCVAGSRLLVQRSIHKEFVERYAYAAKRIPIGSPMLPENQIGPINNLAQLEKVQGMVMDAIADGAVLVAGGKKPEAMNSSGGYFFEPTILDNVDPSQHIAREEVFGPVVVVIPFDTEQDAIEIANDSPYGLAGAVWTKDVARGHRVAAKIKAGTFWINSYKSISVMTPFGGFGQSGYGRSSGKEALMAYTQTKSVWVETAAEPRKAFGYFSED